MSDSSQAGPQFGDLEYQFLGSPREDDEERRRCYRRPFFAIQRIAPYSGGAIPDEAEFFCVESRDLTSEGVCLVMPARPESASLVIAVEAPWGTEHVAAEVIHCTEALVHASGLIERVDRGEVIPDRQACEDDPAELMVLVGCRFTRRLNGPGAEAP